jgi:hypothetical protein
MMEDLKHRSRHHLRRQIESVEGSHNRLSFEFAVAASIQGNVEETISHASGRCGHRLLINLSVISQRLCSAA